MGSTARTQGRRDAAGCQRSGWHSQGQRVRVWGRPCRGGRTHQRSRSVFIVVQASNRGTSLSDILKFEVRKRAGPILSLARSARDGLLRSESITEPPDTARQRCTRSRCFPRCAKEPRRVTGRTLVYVRRLATHRQRQLHQPMPRHKHLPAGTSLAARGAKAVEAARASPRSSAAGLWARIACLPTGKQCPHRSPMARTLPRVDQRHPSGHARCSVGDHAHTQYSSSAAPPSLAHRS